jgi:hypothetical protein
MIELLTSPGFWAALFSVDSILTVVGMTDIFLVMLGSVVISVDLYQNWWDAARQRKTAPVALHHRKK